MALAVINYQSSDRLGSRDTTRLAMLVITKELCARESFVIFVLVRSTLDPQNLKFKYI